MAMTERLNQVTNEILLEWAAEFVRYRKEAVRKAKLFRQGELEASFEQEVIRAAANEVATAIFAFEEYGRILDMKKLKRNQQMPVNEIEDWVKKVGVDKFRSVFAKKRKLPVSNDRLANMVAWGIVKSGKRRRRRWYSKGREPSFGVLYERLREAYMEVSLDELKNATKTGKP